MRNGVTRHKQQGSVLIVAVFLLVLVFGVSAAITHMSLSAGQTTSIHMDSERAFYAAESARIMSSEYDDDDYPFPLGDSGDLYACRITSEENKECGVTHAESGCGNQNLYIGWVGESWDNARARHAICAGAGTTLEPLPSDVDLKNPEDLKEYFDWVVGKGEGWDDASGVPHKKGDISIFAHSDAHFKGAPHWEMEAPMCVSKGAKFSGLSGSFNFVFFKNQDAFDEKDWDKTSIDCAYVAGERDKNLESNGDADCPDIDFQGSNDWCAASSGGSSGGSVPWGYADFSGN